MQLPRPPQPRQQQRLHVTRSVSLTYHLSLIVIKEIIQIPYIVDVRHSQIVVTCTHQVIAPVHCRREHLSKRAMAQTGKSGLVVQLSVRTIQDVNWVI